ncbi:hypothetical protein ABDD95_12590 [Mucilaginibacter sp. PAMB04274]|uniref:hypothetical protein n=1 Tax=Mucilaginibacter sp. PAMB04274 TaxID=3138568 RepID=UPI0031F5FF2E
MPWSAQSSRPTTARKGRAWSETYRPDIFDHLFPGKIEGVLQTHPSGGHDGRWWKWCSNIRHGDRRSYMLNEGKLIGGVIASDGPAVQLVPKDEGSIINGITAQ